MPYSRMNSYNQASVDVHPSAIGVAKYPLIWPDDVIEMQMYTPQTSPDDTSTYAQHANAPNWSGMHGSDSIWSTARPICPSAANTSDYLQNDINTSFLHQFLTSNAAMQFPTSYHPAVSANMTPTAVGVDPTPYLVQEIHPTRKPTGGLAAKHTSSSRLPAHSTARSRHTPYPLSRDATEGTRQRSPSLYMCQWTNGTTLCGQSVSGTKKTVGQHLQTAHGIRAKSDETACLWENCGKYMRRESIARHIVAVHMQSKVDCPGCGLYFARLDSLQRHQRACRLKTQGESTAEASGTGDGCT